MSSNTKKSESFEAALEGYSSTSRMALKKAQGMGIAVSSVTAMAVGTSESEAALTIVDLNRPIPNPAGSGETPSEGSGFQALIDVNGDGVIDFEFQRNDAASYPNVLAGGFGGAQIIGRASGAYNYASRLATGASVGPGGDFLAGSAVDKILAFTYSGTSSGGDWLGGGTGFLGFSIPDGGDVRYGWFEVTVNADNMSGEVIRYGIESDINVPVAAGVPEPNSLACLAIGAAGLLGWRNRRKSA